MSRMNGPTRKYFYNILAQRDKEYCKSCGRSAKECQLVIDHKNNNNDDMFLENLQLLCRRCNYLKNPRPVDSVNECVNLDEQSEMSINRQKEPQFRKFVYHILNEDDDFSESEIINSGSEEVGISPVTAKRYVNKMCSFRGICERVSRINGIYIQYKKDIPGV